jgi:glycosyltransferase involved in cell wall biosynthesis
VFRESSSQGIIQYVTLFILEKMTLMESKDSPLVSIIINNYNYECFLQSAIDSALEQTYENIEIIVVDDGSNDSSPKIIYQYGTKIVPIFKENGGQASSLNQGFQASSGDILCFLDADDMFYKNKIEQVVNLLDKLEWQNHYILLNNFLDTIDQKGDSIEIDLVNEILSAPGEWQFLKELNGKSLFFEDEINLLSTSEQVYQFANKYRFIPYLGVQTSGITITRSLAKQVFPLPQESIRISADVFLVKAASLNGKIYSTNYPLTKYRIHGNNGWYGNKIKKEFEEQKKFFLELDKFLNFKLKVMGKREVFSYMKSMVAKSYYRFYFDDKCGSQLFNLALDVIRWHFNRTTIYFFIKTIALIVFFQYKNLTTNSPS